MSSKILFVVLCLPLVFGISQKRGVAVKKSDLFCEDLDYFNYMGWWYDWRCSLDYYRDASVCGDAINAYENKFYSMIWGSNQTDLSCIETNSPAVLGMNEPNRVKQANMSPFDAASAWRNIEAAAGDKVLVSPSAAGPGCTSPTCSYGNMTWWFDEFFRYCTCCRVDYLATHVYKCNVDGTMDLLESLYIRYGKKIWLTEFACNDPDNNATAVYKYMEGILPRLEAADFVERYSWYMMRIKDDSNWMKSSASLLEPDGYTLTPLGILYRDYEYTP